ncbi:hypothetical protein NPIL_10361 [Nephila pilipes]|uniref:Uncharacterized protein n=1 Tax=Nephila pilipes TaxID=299642 RepID=A0A8X6USQ4_NEPPI|nr:hypothetical protein NPIL_10361 [Nephila pilipes]
MVRLVDSIMRVAVVESKIFFFTKSQLFHKSRSPQQRDSEQKMKILQSAGLYLVLLCPSNQNSHTGFYVITTTNHSISSSRVQLHSILTSRSRSHALLHSTMTSHSSPFVFRQD